MIRFLAIFCFGCSALFGAYYKLDDFDSRYRELKDSPLPPQKGSQLHPSSLYSHPRPARIEREIPTERQEIPQNNQALMRLKRIAPPPTHFLTLGFYPAINLFTFANESNDNKAVALDLSASLGYLHYFYKNHAFRIYAKLGGKAPFYKEIPAMLSFSSQLDFLINVKYFDFVLGAGYGGEYQFSHKFLSHGFLINVGLSKRVKSHRFEALIAIPFYKVYLQNNTILNHNIDFIFGYSYEF